MAKVASRKFLYKDPTVVRAVSTSVMQEGRYVEADLLLSDGSSRSFHACLYVGPGDRKDYLEHIKALETLAHELDKHIIAIHEAWDKAHESGSDAA